LREESIQKARIYGRVLSEKGKSFKQLQGRKREMARVPSKEKKVWPRVGKEGANGKGSYSEKRKWGLKT